MIKCFVLFCFIIVYIFVYKKILNYDDDYNINLDEASKL